MSGSGEPDAAAILAERVHAGGRSKPFAEVTLAEVEARAQELREATGWGPTARVGSVAREWAALARWMAEHGAESVGEVAPEELVSRAQKLWIVPPGGSLL